MKQIDRIEYLEAQNKKLEHRVAQLETGMASLSQAMGTLLASLEEEEDQEEAAPLDLDGNASGGERDQSQPL